MQTTVLYIGADVAKAELVISVAGQRPCIIANTATGITRWLKTVSEHALIAMESTGSYHALLAQLAYLHGLTVYILNARDVFYYARALGSRAKTDNIDAEVIVRYLQEHQSSLQAWQPLTPEQQQLRQLLSRRAQVITHQSALRQAFTDVDLSGVDTQALQHGFDVVLASMDQQIQQLIANDPQLERGYQRLRSVSGIGQQTAALLTELLNRIPFANADALVAYSGLDPRPNDSGAKRGRRRISKRGPALLRRQLYLAAMSACRSAACKPLYEAYRARGLAGTESIVILARKLLRIAYAVWKSGQAFDPSKLSPKTA